MSRAEAEAGWRHLSYFCNLPSIILLLSEEGELMVSAVHRAQRQSLTVSCRPQMSFERHPHSVLRHGPCAGPVVAASATQVQLTSRGLLPGLLCVPAAWKFIRVSPSSPRDSALDVAAVINQSCSLLLPHSPCEILLC